MSTSAVSTSDVLVENINKTDKSKVDETVLLAEVEAFRIRSGKRNTRDVAGVKALINAVDAIAKIDSERGTDLLILAKERYQQSIGTENQMCFLLGALLGSLGIFLIARLLIMGSSEKWPILENLVGPAQLATLTFFAVVGTLTSIMLRLPSINIRNEERRSYVMFSAAIHPLMATGFMSIVYVILKYKIIGITLGDESNAVAFTWLSAFLCGFSEKFAPTLLDTMSNIFLKKESKQKGGKDAN